MGVATLTEEVLDTHDPHHLDIEAVIDSVNPLGVILILMSRLVPAKDPLLTLAPAPALFLGHRLLVVIAMKDEIDRVTDTVVPTADRSLPTATLAEEPGDAARNMVIEPDPLLEVIHRAHVLPEETETDGGLPPAA